MKNLLCVQIISALSLGSVIRFCPGVPVHKGITIVLFLFRSHWLAVVYCLVLCSGSCEPIHEDRTRHSFIQLELAGNLKTSFDFRNIKGARSCYKMLF